MILPCCSKTVRPMAAGESWELIKNRPYPKFLNLGPPVILMLILSWDSLRIYLGIYLEIQVCLSEPLYIEYTSE